LLHCNKKAGINRFYPYNSPHAALQHKAKKPVRSGNNPRNFTFWRIFMMTAEQMMASHKANLETLFGLTSKAFEGMEKMVELNLAASKAVLADASANSQALMAVKDAQELMAMQASMLQPVAEKTAAYSRHLYDIATSTGTEFTKVAEAKAAEAQASVGALVDSVSKNAPAGSDSVVSIMKGAVTAANNALESVQKAVKQATEMAEANFHAVSATAATATKQASAGGKKR